MIEPVYYSIDLPLSVWCLLGAMLLSMIMIGCIMWPKLHRVRNKINLDNETQFPSEGYPAVSVVVYAQAAAANLRTLLPQILEQDYPAPMEVIVVNDETDDNTENIVSELELHYHNLYMTFAPERSRSLSRRKLSLTLGIKAARYETLLFTEGNCRISSPTWMRRMMRHFIEGNDVVLGYAELREAEDSKPLARRFAWDNVCESVRWLSTAICRKPLRGTACNLAYRRQLFFDHKGFSRTLHLRNGDDDIYVNEIASGRTTAVELSDDARVIQIETAPNEMAAVERMRRNFTASYLPRRSYLSQALCSILWWVWAVCGIAASVVALPSLIPAIISFVLSFVFCFISMAQWKRTSVALGSRPLFWTVPWLAWCRPMRTFSVRINGRKKRRENLTHLI